MGEPRSGFERSTSVLTRIVNKGEPPCSRELLQLPQPSFFFSSKPGRPVLNRTGHLALKHLTESTSAPRSGEIRTAEKSSLSTASCKATLLGANKSWIQA